MLASEFWVGAAVSLVGPGGLAHDHAAERTVLDGKRLRRRRPGTPVAP